MPRYDDRHSSTRLYVGHLSARTRSRDLEDLFARYGRVRAVDMKRDYAFVEFGDPRDADDARYSMDGREFKGSRISVEFSRGTPRGSGGSHDYLERGPPPGSGRCFNCGIDGHWARDCKAGDWKNKCYRCGERGHIERKCPNSPKKLSRERRYSRSPSPRRGRSRSRSFSRSRSYGRSRSPVKRERERSHDDVERRPRSPGDSRSPPMRDRSPFPGGRRDSPAPNDKNPRGRANQSPDDRKWENGSDYDNSPRGRREDTPMSDDKNPRSRADHSPDDQKWDNGSDYGNSPRGMRDSPASDDKNPRDRADQSPDDRKYDNESDDGNSTGGRKDSPKPDDQDPRDIADQSPDGNESDNGNTPRLRSRSRSPVVDTEAAAGDDDNNDRSPVEEIGRDRSPSPVPRDDDNVGSPKGSL